MGLLRIFVPFRFPGFTVDERPMLRVQLPLVLGLSLILLEGYNLQHELRAAAEQRGLHVLFRGWDGFAWIVWPLAAPAMLLMIRRFPLEAGRIKRNLGRLVLGSVGLYFVVTNLRLCLRLLPNLWIDASAELPIDLETYVVSILVLMPLDLLTYCGFFSLSFAVNYYFKHRRRAEEAYRLTLRTAQLESDLALAELKALRGQLHPHFLFNSFNAVTTLMRQQRNDAAVEVLAQLGSLLRLAIDRTGVQELSLEDEVDFIQRYLKIEQIRFGAKLQLEYDVDPAARLGLVPNLVLQPLVENAIKHGISRRVRPGRVRIAVHRRADRLSIEIENDGPEPTGAMVPNETARIGGVGLTNTRNRLEKIYGSGYRLAMISRPDGGMRVDLDVPWRLVQRSKSL